MEVPIACSLDDAAAQGQLGEWARLLRRSVASAERVTPGRLDLVLGPGADLATVVGLAQREAACCPFFTFTVRIGANEVVLSVEAPEEAVTLVDEFARVAAPLH